MKASDHDHDWHSSNAHVSLGHGWVNSSAEDPSNVLVYERNCSPSTCSCWQSNKRLKSRHSTLRIVAAMVMDIRARAGVVVAWRVVIVEDEMKHCLLDASMVMTRRTWPCESAEMLV